MRHQKLGYLTFQTHFSQNLCNGRSNTIALKRRNVEFFRSRRLQDGGKQSHNHRPLLTDGHIALVNKANR